MILWILTFRETQSKFPTSVKIFVATILWVIQFANNDVQGLLPAKFKTQKLLKLYDLRKITLVEFYSIFNIVR